MRYVTQFLAMWPVIGFSIYSIWLLSTDWGITNVLFIIVGYALLVLLDFFYCWKPANIKKFMENAKKYGL